MRGWRPWTVQPPPGTPIDWDSPHSHGLVDVIEMYGLPRSKLLGTPATIFGTSQTYGFPSAQGVALNTLASFSGVVFERLSDGLYTPPAQTHIALQRRAAYSGDYAGLFCSAEGNGSSNSLVLQASSSSITNGTYYLGGSPLDSYTIPLLANTATQCIAVAGGASGITMYVNGAFAVATASTVAVSALGTSRLVLFGERTASPTYATEGLYALHLFYNVEKDTTSAETLSRNPWQVYHRRRRVYSLITGSTISASISESVTSADSYALSATAAAAISAAATADATYALAATVPSAISEAISPSDVYALAVTVAAALDSAAAASSALTAVATIAATIAEVSTAQDTLGVTATILAAIAEAATATDTQATGSVTSAAYAESATAAAIFNATVSIAATLTEAGLAADQIAAMATVAADLAESGAASDAYLRSVLLAVELLENAAAADELSAAAFKQIIDAAKTIITIVQARDTVNIVQAQDTLRILQ